MRGLVEVVNVRAVVGEHHVAGGAAACFLPPVREQTLLRERRVVVDGETASVGRVGEVRLRVAVPQAGECLAFERVALATIARELDHVEPVTERLIEAAGTDRGQLRWVADQEQLSLCPLDRVQQRRENARLSHPRLIDDEHAAAGQANVTLGIEQESVQGAARDARG